MRLSLGTDKSARRSLKIELKALSPGAGLSGPIPSGVTPAGAPPADCFTGNRVFHSPQPPIRTRHHAYHPGMRPQRGL